MPSATQTVEIRLQSLEHAAFMNRQFVQQTESRMGTLACQLLELTDKIDRLMKRMDKAEHQDGARMNSSFEASSTGN